MKKIILLMCIIALSLSANAEGIVTTKNLDSSDNAKFIKYTRERRELIYKQLNFTPLQSEKIQNLDNAYYADIDPYFTQINNQIKNVLNMDDKTFEKLNPKDLKNECKDAQKNISEISTNYKKDFKKILTKEQNKQYKKLISEERKTLNREIQQIKHKHEQERVEKL